MKKVLALATATFVAVSLTGCALLYPNWGTEQKPSDPASPSSSASASPSEAPSETATPSESPSKVLRKVTMNLIMSEVDLPSQSFYVVAEALDLKEADGVCTFSLRQGDVSRTVQTKSEPNVTSTQCFPVYLSYGDFKKGTATLSIKYESDLAFSDPASFEVNVP